MNHRKIAGVAVLGAALALSNSASAQNILSPNTRGRAVVLNLGGGYGGWGGGARVDLEYQQHFRGRYEGPGFGVGLTFPLWAGFGIGVEGRFMYDWQPIPDVAFLVTPYIGLSAGFWSWTYYCGGGGGCAGAAAAWIGPEAGLDLKFVLFERFVLGFRPVGISVPFVAYNGFNAGWGYHGALILGLTF